MGDNWAVVQAAATTDGGTTVVERTPENGQGRRTTTSAWIVDGHLTIVMRHNRRSVRRPQPPALVREPTDQRAQL